MNAGSENRRNPWVSALRTLRSSAFLADDLTGERHALPAFGSKAQRAIGLAGADCTLTGSGSHIVFANCIADADDHRFLTLNSNDVALLRAIRKQIARHSQLCVKLFVASVEGFRATVSARSTRMGRIGTG